MAFTHTKMADVGQGKAQSQGLPIDHPIDIEKQGRVSLVIHTSDRPHYALVESGQRLEDQSSPAVYDGRLSTHIQLLFTRPSFG
jgi:hypothetical protein